MNLPTGGAIEYDFGDGSNGNTSGFQGSATDSNPVMIYRRLQERREYATGGSGSSWTSRTRYTVSYATGTTTDTDVLYNTSQAAIGQTAHLIDGSPLDALSLGGTGCNVWNEGLETQTSFGVGGLTTVSNVYKTQSGCMNNPTLSSQVTTWASTNQQSKQAFIYDQYNNVMDKKEYDWGTGAPGALLRDTQSAYRWTASTGYAAPALNLVHASSSIIIFDGSAHRIAETDWKYDEAAAQRLE